eukprot:scaffold76826_cov29-Attheya_sp.AAC.1
MSYQQDDAVFELDDHESDHMDHAEGEVEQLLFKRWQNMDMTWLLHYQHQMKSYTPSLQQQNKHDVMLTYYKNGIEDEDRYVEGTTVKVGGAEWLTCVTGVPHGTISTTANLMDATKWM